MTKYLSISLAFGHLGITVGPGIQAALALFHFSTPSENTYISMDMFTAAGCVYNPSFLETKLISKIL